MQTQKITCLMTFDNRKVENKLFNIIIILISLMVCVIHLHKFGIEDRFDIDFLVLCTLLITMFLYNTIVLLDNFMLG